MGRLCAALTPSILIHGGDELVFTQRVNGLHQRHYRTAEGDRGHTIVIVTPVEYELVLPPSEGRSPGIHASSIIRNIAIENGILTTDQIEELSLVDSREITDPVAVLRILLGIGWERVFIPEILSRYHDVEDHPAEICRDNVYMSRDGESVSVIITVSGGTKVPISSGQWVTLVHEVKCTWKSTKTVGEDLRSQWMWLAQLKAYCIARNTRFGVLHVMFVCGDYKYPIKPQHKSWLIEFSQSELDSNWQLLTDYRDHWLALQAKENDGLYGFGE